MRDLLKEKEQHYEKLTMQYTEIFFSCKKSVEKIIQKDLKGGVTDVPTQGFSLNFTHK